MSTALERITNEDAAVQAFHSDMLDMREDFVSLLSKNVNPDHFIEVALTAFIDPDNRLRQCSPLSLMGALRRCAQLNLRPDGEEAALIAYGETATVQPMYKGLVRTILRTGLYRKVEARLQRTGDLWEYRLGLHPDIIHTPAAPDDRGEIEHAYAIVWGRDGQTQFEVMHRQEMDEIRAATKKRNRGREGPAWSTKYGAGQMYRKMPIKRLAKLLELDASQAAVFWYDDQVEIGNIHADPADMDPSSENRSIQQRTQAAAEGQLSDIRDRIHAQKSEPEEEIPEADVVASEPAEEAPADGEQPQDGIEEAKAFMDSVIGFGKHKDLTWREAAKADRGWVRRYGAISDKLTDQQRGWLTTFCDALREREIDRLCNTATALSTDMARHGILTMEESELVELLVEKRNKKKLRNWLEDAGARVDEYLREKGGEESADGWS